MRRWQVIGRLTRLVPQNWGAGGLLLACLCLPAGCAPKAILFLSSAPTVRSVFEADAPVLQSLITHGGVAVMTSGPEAADSFATLVSNRYVYSKPRGAGWLAERLAGIGGVAFVGNPDDNPSDPYSNRNPGGALNSNGWPSRPRLIADIDTLSSDAAVLVLAPEPDWIRDPSPGQVSRSVHDQDSILSYAMRRFPGVPIVALTRWGIGPRLSWLVASNLRGRLTSDTTRTHGVVSNLDVAPTIIAMVTGKAPTDTAGHAIVSGPPEGLQHGMPKPVSSTIRLQEALGVLEQVTNPTNYALAFGAIALIVAGSLLSGVTGKPRFRRWTQRALLLPAAIPLAVAIASTRLPDSKSAYYLLAAALTAASLAGFVLLGKAIAVSRDDVAPATVEIALGALCAFVMADVARHGMALRLSPLSNFYQTGVRFYGLGNEYGAVFIAAFTLVGLIALQRSGATAPGRGGLLLLGGWYGACALLVGWPSLGANMGGIVIALITGGIAWSFVAGKARVPLPWLWALTVSTVCLAAVYYADTHSGHPTHLAHFVGGSAVGQREAVLLNKAEMNARLIVQPPALLIYVLAAGFTWYWWRRLGVARRRTVQAYPWIAIGIRSVLYGGTFALLTKDTGVVMLGLMAIVSIGIGVILALEPAQPIVMMNVPERR